MPANVPDERRCDQSAEDGGRLVDGAESLHDSENGGDDAESGERLRDRVDGVIGLAPVALQGVDFLFHERFDLMGAGISDDDQASVVADEEREILVLEHARKRLEDLGFFRLIDMALDLVAGGGSSAPA